MQQAPPFLYDGDRGFCRRWVDWLRRRVPESTSFVAYQHVDDLAAYGLREADVRTASYWVDQAGTRHRSASSFAVLRQGTGPWAALGAFLRALLVRSSSGASIPSSPATGSTSGAGRPRRRLTDASDPGDAILLR